MKCLDCDEWFEVITNTYGLGLNYCPCCGIEVTEDNCIEDEDIE